MILTINYDIVENKVQYYSINISDGSFEYQFETGSFVKDWFTAIQFLLDNNIDNIASSSTLDHFFMDGAEYDEIYFYIENKRGFLTKQKVKGSIKYYIEKDTFLQWEDFKNKYKYKI